MPELYELVALVALAAATSMAAQRFGVMSPILLLVVGVVVSYLPGHIEVRLDPDVVLWGLLPPLIYVTANQMSSRDFRQELRSILLLAVGLVLATAFAVGLVLHLAVPGVGLAAALALGAVVAPPDPVAASTVARRVGLPQRIVTILEGEGMLNDATALVLLGVVAASITGEAVSAVEVSLEAVTAVVGGLGVGLGVAWLAAWIHRRTRDPLFHNTVSLLTPFVAYAAAERIEGSGVLAVSVVGLYLGRRWTKLVRAESRIQMTAFWKMVNFVLESVVFLLVGFQMRDILDDLNMPTGDVVTATIVVLVTVVVVRMAWMVAAMLWGRLSPGTLSPDRHRTSVRTAIVLGWAGMRGVITLAAAFTLPHTDADGAALADRNLLIWLAFAVIVATLLGQGMTLAPLIRWLNIPRDDPAEERLAVAHVQKAATKAALVALDEASAGVPDEVVDQLRRLAERRTKKKLDRLDSSADETPSDAYRRLRRVMLTAEQSTYRAAYNDGHLSHKAMRKAQRHFDLEESLLG